MGFVSLTTVDERRAQHTYIYIYIYTYVHIYIYIYTYPRSNSCPAQFLPSPILAQRQTGPPPPKMRFDPTDYGVPPTAEEVAAAEAREALRHRIHPGLWRWQQKKRRRARLLAKRRARDQVNVAYWRAVREAIARARLHSARRA
jgi:hypothetical protein